MSDPLTERDMTIPETQEAKMGNGVPVHSEPDDQTFGNAFAEPSEPVG